MCNDYEQHVLYAMYCRAMQEEAWRMPACQTELDLPPADDIRIRDVAPVALAAGDALQLQAMRWGHALPTGKPMPWLKSEGRRFGDSRRCIVPASAFFEFTGTKSPKAKHRFALADAPFLGIAATWKPGVGNEHPTFAMLTTGPGPDIAPYHDRQLCVLAPRDWRAWLDLTRPEAELLAPATPGTLTVETVRA